ncbi:MAG: hypothetical protein Ct9H90mP4_13700 [Gammaproteobacteria bacterium]|nr:MAG: hypothetical protein Ct9H90mP4_13700 [Gammaproteobacteria bacterium]
MIVSGGENIYPAEVENGLMSHGEILDAAVIGNFPMINGVKQLKDL